MLPDVPDPLLRIRPNRLQKCHYPFRLTRQASLPSLNKEKTTNLSASNQSNPVRRSTVVARSPSSAKEVILSWVQERTNTYSVSSILE